MKFRAAIIISVIFHISIFALVIYVPKNKSGNETTYYVDLVNFSGGGRGGKGIKKDMGSKSGASIVEENSVKVKDLIVKKSVKSKFRHPDKKGKKIIEKPEKKLVSVVRKKRKKSKKELDQGNLKPNKGDSSVLKTGISSGGGDGIGNGTGSGYGGGNGTGGYSFPYAYYIDTLKNKISSSWYNSLISPGLREKRIAIVCFKIYRNGEMRDLILEKNSGIDSIDLSALRAVENAAPFPPLPSDFTSRYLIVHFEFECEK